MSGHNKWSTIKHKKEKTDAQRGKIFTKIGREIAIAVREGGPDPNTNSKLKDVVAKAKAANMPNENIQRSIKKASGEGDATQYKEVTYEGYAPGGVAVIVELVTDNLNRTASEVRHIFDKCGGSLGAVSYTHLDVYKRQHKAVFNQHALNGILHFFHARLADRLVLFKLPKLSLIHISVRRSLRCWRCRLSTSARTRDCASTNGCSICSIPRTLS